MTDPIAAASSSTAADAQTAGTGGLALLGRAEELAWVAELLQLRRFVTIVGPGGIGKTSLARAVAAQCSDLYPDGVRVVDLAALAQGRDLAGALGFALGIEHLTWDGLPQLGACLRGQRMLVLFDCCEHHTGVTAQASEALLRAGAGIDVLCTSREPLLAHGEQIVRLGPIGFPGADDVPDAAAALGFPAIELFVARANADNPTGFVVDDGNVALVCELCRAVEGGPLALELAAALVRSLGLQALARQTARWLRAPPGERRPAERRHQTLASMLDWSYDALSTQEQQVLRSLAVFRGEFTLEAAATVAAGAGADPDKVVETVLELAAKSLVRMETGGDMPRPRLLDVTRSYAYDKLERSGELALVRARHAGWLGTLMDRLDRDWMILSRADWVALYRPWVDDILSAVEWTLGPGGQPVLGAKLAAVGFSVGDQLGNSREFAEPVRLALDALGKMPDAPPSIMLRLVAVAGDGSDPSGHPFIMRTGEAEQCLQLARQTGLPLLQGAPLVSLWGWHYVRGDYPASLAGAKRLEAAAQASAEPALELLGQRTVSQSLHFLGRHAESQRFAMQTLANSQCRIPLPCLPSPVNVGTSIRITLARTQWMTGAADQAVVTGEEALALSEGDRPVAMCQALALAAVPVALWRGDTLRARELVRRLRDRAERHGMRYWLDWARRFEDVLEVIEGHAGAASRASFDDTHVLSAMFRDHLTTFSPSLLRDDAVARAEAGLVGWCLPELLRARALRLLALDGIDRSGAAAALLQRSLAQAQAQGAHGWALRGATSLAALRLRQGARARARATLEPALARCREGRGSADLRTALALMASLG